MTDIQREAREAAIADHKANNLERPYDWMRGFEAGYLAAAAPREQELERLRTDLAKTKLPIWMLREEHEKEVAALRARVDELELEVEITAREALDRIAELEGMVPRWVAPRSEESDDLLLADWMCHWPQCMKDRWLMVPPIPLPETKTSEPDGQDSNG